MEYPAAVERAMKEQEVISKKITWWQAAEILGARELYGDESAHTTFWISRINEPLAWKDSAEPSAGPGSWNRS